MDDTMCKRMDEIGMEYYCKYGLIPISDEIEIVFNAILIMAMKDEWREDWECCLAEKLFSYGMDAQLKDI